VDVGIIEDSRGLTGFFPFERSGPDEAVPVGEPLNDCQAVVAPPGLDFDPVDLLHGCGLRCWHFNHLLASQAPFRPFHRVATESPIIDLSHGYEVWRRSRPGAGTRPLAGLANLERRLERKLGPLRFEPDCHDTVLLDTLLRWKSAQYQRTGVPDRFADGGRPGHILRLIHAESGAGFAGMLSALWAGETLLALHFGMRSDRVLHYWFPAYDPTFAWTSPGTLLLVRLAAEAAKMGLRTLDLGKGRAPYKERFRSSAVPLAEGLVDVPVESSRSARATLAQNADSTPAQDGAGREAPDRFSALVRQVTGQVRRGYAWLRPHLPPRVEARLSALARTWDPSVPSLPPAFLRYLDGRMSAPMAVLELLGTCGDIGRLRALVVHAQRGPVAADPARRARLQTLCLLLDENRSGCDRVASMIRAVQQAQVPEAAGTQTVAAFARLFDSLVQHNEEASVAFYSLANPILLAVATREVVDFLRTSHLLGPTRRVLEIGCGIGRILTALAPEVRSGHGVDVSAAMIATARRRSARMDNIHLHLTGGEDLTGFDDGAFDLVLAIDSWPYLVHAGEKVVQAHFADIARVLPPGGDLVVMNYSYRGDVQADRRDLRRLSAPCGLAVVADAVTPFALWDAVVWHLRRLPPEEGLPRCPETPKKGDTRPSDRWEEISAAQYGEAFAAFGGSFSVHPRVVDLVFSLSGQRVGYFGCERDGRLIAAVPALRGQIVATDEGLDRLGLAQVIDVGHGETVLPIAHDVRLCLPFSVDSLSPLHLGNIENLREDPAFRLALARSHGGELPRLSSGFKSRRRRQLRHLLEAGGTCQSLDQLPAERIAEILCALYAKRWGASPQAKDSLPQVLHHLRPLLMGFALFHYDQPISINIAYAVEHPRFLLTVDVTSAMDRDFARFSPGSVLLFLNTRLAEQRGQQLGKPVRFSFGRAENEYKHLWCHEVAAYRVLSEVEIISQ
jgi:CelD/BcsL family acetyltransferase involved in cellulose biosynthesis/ubiquinone/menaquinone biosynthesis C-methylase UbiE